MAMLVMLFYIGHALNAPVWYWCLFGVEVLGWLIRLIVKAYKLGVQKEESDA